MLPDLVLRGRVVTPTSVLDDGLVAVAGTSLLWVGEAAGAPDRGWPEPWSTRATLLPGLVDVHCHGAVGHSFPDGDPAGDRAAARHHLEHGTTGLVASLVSAAEPDLLLAVSACAGLVESGELVGIHLEGPFLSMARRGSHDPGSLRAPDLAMVDRLLDAGRGHVLTMTVAGELPGADDLVRHLGAAGVVASLGHTDADAGTAARILTAAAAASPTGLAGVTHLFNGMPPLHHRDPGPVAACLAAAARGEAVLELVADGVHLADETVAAVVELVGAGSVALVTDAMAATGMPDGTYRLGPAQVQVQEGVARVAGDEEASARSLAGGTMRLLDVVRRCVQVAGLDLVDAVRAASATPARLIGVGHQVGALQRGLRADVVVVDETLHPLAVLRAGSWSVPPATG